jgi:peptide-methionine (R)-S-oxide reductase
MYGYFVLFHVLAATIWTGGHLVLALTILPRALRTRRVEELHWFEEGYEKIGIPALVIQVVTGLYLAHHWVPNPGRWLAFGEPAERLVGFKLVLLAITVGFAMDARLRLIPRLTRDRLSALAWHIVPVTVVSVAFVVVGVSFRTGWFHGQPSSAAGAASESERALNVSEAKRYEVEKSDEQWREELTPEQYRILRQKGTERAFTGEYWATKTPGVYRCAGCGQELFVSDAKYDSGCGWPSFDRAIAGDRVEEHVDRSLGMIRTEVVCSRCGGHLGHVFPDGPPTTGMRYCINSGSIKLEARKQPGQGQ